MESVADPIREGAGYTSIRVETTDRVTTVVMNRPERRNAVDGTMASELAHAFTVFDADPTPTSLCSTGTAGTSAQGRT